MDDLQWLSWVVGLFLLRIGLPIAVLLGLGALVDRLQHQRADAVTYMLDGDPDVWTADTPSSSQAA